MRIPPRHIPIIAASVLLLVTGALFFVVVNPFRWGETLPEEQPLQDRMAYRKEIADLRYTPIAPTLASEFENVFQQTALDPNSLATPRQEQELAEIVFAQILARSGPDAQAYLDLAEADHTHWIDPDEPANAQNWSRVNLRHEHLFGRPAPKDDVEGVLRRFLTYSYEHDQSLLTGVNVTDRPPYVYFYHVRTPLDIIRRADDPMDREAFDDWYNAPIERGFVFREPERSLDDVLRAKRIALCAAVYVVVETEAGNQYNFETHWYWDPQNSRWENYSVARRGWYRHAMHF